MCNCNGGSVIDDCGVCGGNNNSMVDDCGNCLNTTRVITGNANLENAIVGVYTNQGLVRVDFQAPPTVLDNSGSTITLPVSVGSNFVSGSISSSFG